MHCVSRPSKALAVLITVLMSVSLVANAAVEKSASPEPVTFFVASDPHYEMSPYKWRNKNVPKVIKHMNQLPGSSWPSKFDAGEVHEPRGVFMLGDLIDDGDRGHETAAQWAQYASDVGLTEKGGLLKSDVFEAWGNHDGPPIGQESKGFSTQKQLKRRNQYRKQLGLVDHISDNGMHISWDWGNVHFIMAGIYPANQQNEKVGYNRVWHDPQNALEFVKKDLRENVGDSGRPVVIGAHCGFDTDWWVPEDWKRFYEAVKPYNVILYMHGHTGTKVYSWKPDGSEGEPLNVINTGQAHDNFFVIRVTEERMIFANRVLDHDSDTWSWHSIREIPLNSN